jgi:hypothetical protein
MAADIAARTGLRCSSSLSTVQLCERFSTAGAQARLSRCNENRRSVAQVHTNPTRSTARAASVASEGVELRESSSKSSSRARFCARDDEKLGETKTGRTMVRLYIHDSCAGHTHTRLQYVKDHAVAALVVALAVPVEASVHSIARTGRWNAGTVAFGDGKHVVVSWRPPASESIRPQPHQSPVQSGFPPAVAGSHCRSHAPVVTLHLLGRKRRTRSRS